ncbi:hypothetical protein [uncultured Corynebacterium sp.]|uniref:hypothetical protein n=1 Tax=uncultured Corynebacterium sp. TaxID=159447 RepID=UPI0025CEAC7F|nr:hypothetical protein [uncultured Corynebacterium sp.]
MSPSYSDKHEHMTPAQQAAQDERAESDKRTGIFESAQRAGAPLNDFMTRLIAEELPLLDSASRQRVYDILRAYDGPEITSQAELPEDIIDIMDLY